MASIQNTPLTAKLSFAKVAAMNAPPKSLPARPPPSEDRKIRLQDVPVPIPKQMGSSVVQTPVSARQQPTMLLMTEDKKIDRIEPVYGLRDSIEGLSLVDNKPDTVNGTTSAGSGDSLADDQSNLSNSSFKQPGFDTKSMASVTTFAMDEKESIRPDDSASMRAADDDDVSSVVTKSYQHDQEPVLPMPRNALRDINGPVTIPGRRYHTLTLTNPPRFGDLPISPVLAPQLVVGPAPIEAPLEIREERQSRSPTIPVRPDEKLLDALASPVQRLPLLQLEEKLLLFLMQPSTDSVDLPPQNGFLRLLTHKIADYYNLEHQINDDGMSIRITKTSNGVLPTPLHIVAKSIPAGPITLPNPTAFKIMRRTGITGRHASAGTSTAASSSAPSKATSDAGVEALSEEGMTSPTESTPGREKAKPTREEREAQYKAARDRIFSDFQEPIAVETVSTSDQSATISRSSSSSGKRKAKKSKTPKDDSFEARSAFVAGYTSMPNPAMSHQYQPQYTDPTYQVPFSGSGNGYGTTPTQMFPGIDAEMAYSESQGYMYSPHYHYGASDSWAAVQNPNPSNYGNFAVPPGSTNPSNSHSSLQHHQHFLQSGSNTPHNQGWGGNQYGQSYDQNHNVVNNQALWGQYGGGPGVVPQYGYIPNQPQPFNNNGPFDNQRNIPPGGPRTLFNPQTRSFVPGTTQARSGKNVRKKAVPNVNQPRYGNTLQRTISSENHATTGRSSPRRQDYSSSNNSSPKPREDTLQQKYGAPANLPKKPPPPQVPASHNVDSIYNSNTAVASTPTEKSLLVVNGSATK